MGHIVVVSNLRKYFPVKTEIASLFSRDAKRFIKAVDGVSFDIDEGEIVGLVGESGSGKTTIGRLLLRLDEPDNGEIYISGKKISNLKGKESKIFYRAAQMIFQDPYGSINPRLTVFETVLGPVEVQNLAPRAERAHLVSLYLNRAGLKPPSDFLYKFPHELSGGERQRLSIARALVMQPKVLVADEPVSMLDVSIKAGILNLLKRLSKDFRVTILYISHDLSTVKYMCDRIIIMYLGKFMEIGYTEELIDNPQHPYSKVLRAAIPIPDPCIKRDRVISKSLTEKSLQVLDGCRFNTECKYAMPICMEVEPTLKEIERNHYVACHLY